MSRFSQYKPLDTCASPVVVWHHGQKYVVPCGKCAPCLLNRANDWSFRLGDEISSSPFNIWFTLTYNNKYLPKLKILAGDDFGVCSLVRDDLDIRFDSVKDKLREDLFFPDDLVFRRSDFERMPITNFGDDSYIAYPSKRDIQLFLKNVRKSLTDKFGQSVKLRYYIISELGPRTYRPHYHGLFFVDSKEVADYLVKSCIFENWQMSDKSLFDNYVRYTTGGVENYVTDYVTSTSYLPNFYKSKSFKPFRLASKRPAIGYGAFDEKKVYEDVELGIITYNKSVPSIEKQYTFLYPKNYMARLFPKCFEYGSRSFRSRLSAYGLLYTLYECSRKGYDYFGLFDGLFATMRPSDEYAAKRTLYFCQRYSQTPLDFLNLVARYYSLHDLSVLKNWYRWQEENADKPLTLFRSYQNVGDYLTRYLSLSAYEMFVFDTFASSFGITYDMVKLFKPSDFLVGDDSELHLMYVRDCDYIVSQMDKAKKLNEDNNNNHLSF